MRSTPQLPIQDLEGQPQIEIPLAGKDVRDTILAESRQVRVRDLFGQHGDDRVAADVGPSPGNLAVRVEHDTPGRCIAPREPGFSWIGLVCVIGVSALGEFLTGHATDEPGVAAK
jgi:hypothetical protein